MSQDTGHRRRERERETDKPDFKRTQYMSKMRGGHTICSTDNHNSKWSENNNLNCSNKTIIQLKINININSLDINA